MQSTVRLPAGFSLRLSGEGLMKGIMPARAMDELTAPNFTSDDMLMLKNYLRMTEKFWHLQMVYFWIS